MPWLELRGRTFRIKFRYSGSNHSVPLKSADRREAEGLLGRFEENLRLFERGRLELPEGADLGLFLLTDGKLHQKPQPVISLTTGEVFDLYERTLTAGAKEANTRKSEGIHLAHLRRLIGGTTRASQVTTQTVQAYVDERAAEKNRGRSIRPITVRKEVATFQTVWNWAHRRGHVPTTSPAKGITLVIGI
jgi:hypothetical protein